MKRLRRIIFNALTLLSLAFFVATVIGWVRSYYAWDEVAWHTASGNRYFYTNFVGGFMLGYQRNEVFYPRYDRAPVPGLEILTRPGRYISPPRWSHPRHDWRVFEYGFVVNRGATAGVGARSLRPGGWESFAVILPLWLVLLIAGILPFRVLLARRRMRSRMRIGLCPVCSYDLRATPDRCPECGTIPAKAKA